MTKGKITFITIIFLTVFSVIAMLYSYAEQTERVPEDDVGKGPDLTAATGAVYAPDELLVRFAPKTDGKQRSKAEKVEVLSALGARSLERSYKIVPGLTLVKLGQGQTVKGAMKKFNASDKVLYAEPNYRRRVLATPNDTRFSELWNMHNTGQSGGTADADIDAPEGWDIATDGNSIIVAVIDTGVQYTHPDLSANMWVNVAERDGNPTEDDDGNGYIDDIYGYDFCNDDADPNDDHSHGTRCAGIIGAIGDNNEGVVGVCWKAQIMAVKAFDATGWGTDADVISAIEYSVAMGAKVLSNSWGGDEYSSGLKDAIESADANGVLFVAAAGNSAVNNDKEPIYPASYDCDNIISVMGTLHNDEVASFSCWGPTTVDLSAPTVGILSTTINSGYAPIGGTSASCPHVAGVCTLLWSQKTSFDHMTVKDLVLYVDEIPSLKGLCVTEGRVNLWNTMAWGRPLLDEIQCKESTEWVNGSEITYDSNLTEIRVDFTYLDPNRSVTEVRFKLEYLPDANVIFDHNSDSNDANGWWYYDNNDITISQTGEYEFTITSTDSNNLTRVDSESWMVWRFYIQDSNGQAVARFDNSGHVVLAGTLDTNSAPAATATDEFRVQDSNSNDVAIIDCNSGNMYINGLLYEDQNSLSPPSTDDNFIIEDSWGNAVVYINESGDMYLRGVVDQNSTP